MIIKTRKLPPTQTEPARMRATADNGASLTIPYPYHAGNPDEHVMMGLAYATFRKYPFGVTHRGGSTWEVRGN